MIGKVNIQYIRTQTNNIIPTKTDRICICFSFSFTLVLNISANSPIISNSIEGYICREIAFLNITSFAWRT